MDKFCLACNSVVTVVATETVCKIVDGVMLCLCPQCLADLRLGRMVRDLPVGLSLVRDRQYDYPAYQIPEPWYVAKVTSSGDLGTLLAEGDTPEAALEAAGKEEGK